MSNDSEPASTTTAPENSSAGGHGWTLIWRIIRYAAALILIALSVLAVTGAGTQVCETVVRTGHEAGKTTTCAPPGLDSPLTLAVLLVVILLVLPDMSEVAFLGVSLKRRVEAATESATRAEQATSALSAHVAQLVMSTNAAMASANNSVSLQVFTDADARVLRDAAEAQGETAAPPVYVSDYELIGRIITRWARLEDALKLNMALPELGQVASGSARHFRRNRQLFLETRDDELVALRKLRNAIAHGAAMDRDRLEEADFLLDRLVSDWESMPARPSPF